MRERVSRQRASHKTSSGAQRRDEGPAKTTPSLELIAQRSCGLPLSAVESARTEPVRRAVFAHAKIVHVLEGRARVDTATGSHELAAGTVLALGAGHWCSMRPMPSVRVWTLYVDEAFLRAQMSWVLPDARRVVRGAHPDEWDGSALVLTPGIEALQCCEPLWRRISLLDQTGTPELTATRMIRLFTRAVEYTLPALLIGSEDGGSSEPDTSSFPVKGTLTQPPLAQQVRRSTDLLRLRMAEPWTVHRLAAEVAMSRTHLTRLFTLQVGVAPMRFLTEVRLTEFTRLIEETRMSVSSAAESVGWFDSRVAAAWFRRRFGIGPSEYRRHPHPTCIGEAPCDWCRGACSESVPGARPMRPMTRVLRRDAQIQPNS